MSVPPIKEFLSAPNVYDKSKNIDLDYIEILIRDSFFYGKPGEKVYLINNNEN